VQGEDAAAFLHGQLSRAVDTLDGRSAPLAGWHDARGRVRALFRVARCGDRWLLVTPRDAALSTAARLRMFVLRASVTIALADDVRVGAVVDADGAWLAAHGFSVTAPPGTVVSRGALALIRLGAGLCWALGPAAEVQGFEGGIERAPETAALLAEIALGIPAVGAALVERFVPQMLNLDVLDAVSFDKGCYPGQEVIARVHHRGSVKRRMRRYACASDALPAPASAVAGADGTVVGEVVRAAPARDGVELLAVVDHAAAPRELSSSGKKLRELPLPYAVPTD
jgi:hypothetical protein